MQNESYSFVRGAESGGAKTNADGRSGSIDHMQRLEQDNARLRTIVAELLLKNQSLRWQLASFGSPEMMLASPQGADS